MDQIFCGTIDETSDIQYQLYESGVPQYYSDSLSISYSETPKKKLSKLDLEHSKSCTELLLHKHSDQINHLRSDNRSPSQSYMSLPRSKIQATPTQKASWNIKARQLSLDPGELVKMMERREKQPCFLSPINTLQQSATVPRSPSALENELGIQKDELLSFDSSSMVDSVLPDLESSNDKELIIVDCRWPYEYQGGHIEGAINVNDATDLYHLFFKTPPERHTVLVFYCEYSQVRGPRMSNFFKEAEAALHNRSWFSDVYILTGGYSRFFQTFPTYTDTKQYVSETDPRFDTQRRHFSGDGQYLMNIPAARELVFHF